MFLSRYYLHINVLNYICSRAIYVLLLLRSLKAAYPVLTCCVTLGKPFNFLSLTVVTSVK